MIWWETHGNGLPPRSQEHSRCTFCAVPPGLTRWMVRPITKLESQPGEFLETKAKLEQRRNQMFDFFFIIIIIFPQDGKHSWLWLRQPRFQVCCQPETKTKEEKRQNWTLTIKRNQEKVKIVITFIWRKIYLRSTGILRQQFYSIYPPEGAKYT